MADGSGRFPPHNSSLIGNPDCGYRCRPPARTGKRPLHRPPPARPIGRQMRHKSRQDPRDADLVWLFEVFWSWFRLSVGPICLLAETHYVVNHSGAVIAKATGLHKQTTDCRVDANILITIGCAVCIAGVVFRAGRTIQHTLTKSGVAYVTRRALTAAIATSTHRTPTIRLTG